MLLTKVALGATFVTSVAALAMSIAARSVDPQTCPPMPSRLERLTVERLDVVEPDGTPRMIVASRARFPGSFVRGREVPRPDRNDVAGILFVNDEGTENGGLIQNGALVNGHARAGASLTFDRFRQDQMLQLLVDEDDGEAAAKIILSDRPDHTVYSIEDMFAHPEREPRADARGAPRAFIGTDHGASTLALFDAGGRPRLTLAVTADGHAAITILDEHGKPLRTLAP